VIHLRVAPKAEKLLLLLVLGSLASGLLANVTIRVDAHYVSEYQTYVHNFINSGPLGNWTYVAKPFFPVLINRSQIEIGENWSIVCPLQAYHAYHVYLYGRWLLNSTGRTDYDVYVYGPNGTLVGFHTASGGQYEVLGSGLAEPFFVPQLSGNYTFTINNDPRESSGAEQATFMIIEDVQPNVWHTCQIEGKDNNSLPQYRTSWAYEFVAESSHVEVQINVPNSLDMFEARLFLMANNASSGFTAPDGVPLAWEPGLYGNKTGNIGGYNTDSRGYEGIAYATCDDYGQDMLINLTGPPGKSLYHLALIGEVGVGNVSFLIKTSFDQGLSPVGNPDEVFPEQSANISYVSKVTDLVNATLRYSDDNWETNKTIKMTILDGNRTCTATIPPQEPASQVYYAVKAVDVLGQVLTANGTYRVGPEERTYLNKPMIPVFFNQSQIAIGQEWSIICPLEANHSYHVYFYGKWINTGSQPITDYNIYVYDPKGRMVGYHTASAGLPEHLGTTVDVPFFVPEISGNYTFVIANDPATSKGAQQATFMIIEDAACNVWHQCYIQGFNSQNLPTLNTSWAYEFVTASKLVDVYVKVPETLDMYEARLYLMTDPTSSNQTLLNGVPLAWEPGLYGNISAGQLPVGGYNLDAKEYRGNAWASCELYGQNMYMNFTSPKNQTTLYHLVFIGEVGNGTIQFLIKTEFNESSLSPESIPTRVFPGNNATVSYSSTMAELESASLTYSTDDWATQNTVNMEISNRTCTAAINGQIAGTTVQYTVEAADVLENTLRASGSYVVKYPSTLNFTLGQTETSPGHNVTILGNLTPKAQNLPVTIYFISTNSTKEIVCTTLENGSFSGNFKPESTGTWLVYASFNGTSTIYGSETSMVRLTVQEPLLSKYSIYILGGIGAVAAVVVVFYFRKSRTS
jgi:hypothetical protein